MNTFEGQQEWRKRTRKSQKKTEVVRQCDEYERGEHCEKNDRCGHTRKRIRGRPTRGWKDACDRHYRGVVEIGQYNKQGSMEEKDHQLGPIPST